MTYDWFNIFNYATLLATGLVQKTYTPVLASYGQKTIVVSVGNLVGVAVDEVYLPVQTEGRNPYVQGAYAVYRDLATDEVYLGFEVPA